MLLQLILITSLLLAALWRTSLTPRSAPGTRLAGAWLAAAFIVLALGQFLSLPAITTGIDRLTAAGVGKASYNIATMLGLLILSLFFALTTRRAHPRSWTTTLSTHVVMFAASATALVVLMAMTPAEHRAHSLHSPSLSQWQVAFFYIIGNIYFTYAYCIIAKLLWRYAKERQKHFSQLMIASLRIMTLAAAGQALTAVIRGVWVVNVSLGGPRLTRYEIINWSFANLSSTTFVIGASLLGLAQLIRATKELRRRRQQYRELNELWTALRQAHPELVLGKRAGNRYQRRIIECFDGLARMRPYIGAVGGGVDSNNCTDGELVRRLHQALARKSELESGGLGQLKPVAPPILVARDASGEDIDSLLSLARAFRQHQQPAIEAAQ